MVFGERGDKRETIGAGTISGNKLRVICKIIEVSVICARLARSFIGTIILLLLRLLLKG